MLNLLKILSTIILYSEMNSNPSPEVSNEDIAIMVEKLNKRRESGRRRAQKWYDSHKEEFQEERRFKKLERQEQKKTEE